MCVRKSDVIIVPKKPWEQSLKAGGGKGDTSYSSEWKNEAAVRTWRAENMVNGLFRIGTAMC